MDDIPQQRKQAVDVLGDILNTRDENLIDDISTKLREYIYIPCDDTDEPDVGAFVRYIDQRDFPPVLRSGGYVVDVLGTTVQLKAGRRVWKVYKHLTFFFQKKRSRDYLMDAVMNLIRKSSES